MISFFNLLSGYCKVIISGKGKERFLNLCKNKKILIWNLSRKEESYQFYVSYKAYKMLDEIAEKSNTQLRIEGKYGLPFFLYRHKKRKMFFAGMLFCAISIYVLSLFIWDIGINGTEKYTEDELQTYLTEQGIYPGILKKRVDCPVLEERIRETFDEMAWVSCDIEGTRLTVHVKESIDTSDMKNKKNTVPNDIVASRDGIVESIITRNGTPLVKKGAEVKKGDTLISGVIHYYNDYDELLETSLISADGDIKAKTTYYYEESFPLLYYEKEYTGKETKEYCFELAGFKFPSIGKTVSYEKYDTIKENQHLKIGKSFYLPAAVLVTTYREYSSKKVELNQDQAKEKANEKAQYYLDRLKQEGKEILEKHFQLKIQDGECLLTGNISVLESIGKIRNIP